jgi:DNA gyrase subunit B
MEITFWPSLEVFHTVTDFDYAALERRLHEVAAFEPGLRIVLDDHRPGGRRQHRICCGGIDGLVHYLDRGRKALIDAPISMRDNGDLLDLELALWWTDTAREQVACYTSTLPQRDGGVHRDGLLAGVSRVIARYAQQHGGAESQRVPIVGADALAGLTAVVTVWMCEPEFADETKSELISPAVKPVVESVVADRLSAWLEAHPRQAQAILAHARKAASGRAVCGFAQRLPAGRL